MLRLLITEGQLMRPGHSKLAVAGNVDAQAGHRRRLKKIHDVRRKQVQYIIDEAEDNKEGACVPL